MKRMSKAEALKRYEAIGKHNVIALSFTYNGKEYVISVSEIKPSWCFWQRHRGLHLRMRLKDSVKQTLANTEGCVCLGNTTNIFTRDSKYNRGDQIEAILYTMITGKEWHKDYTPYYEGADIEFGSMRIQVKRENATICSLSSLQRFATA